MILALLARALVLGLSTGLFCIGFCGPLVGPILLARSRSGVRGSAIGIAVFMSGRLAAYLLFGAATGLLGGAFGRLWPVKAYVLPGLYTVLGLLMILYAIAQSFPHLGFCRFLSPRIESNWYFLLAGFVAGINLCPPFLLAATTAFVAGGALQGMLFFFVFFLATSVYLVPFLFSGLLNRFREVRFAARIAAVAAGLYFVYLAARSAIR